MTNISLQTLGDDPTQRPLPDLTAHTIPGRFHVGNARQTPSLSPARSCRDIPDPGHCVECSMIARSQHISYHPAAHGAFDDRAHLLYPRVTCLTRHILIAVV